MKYNLQADERAVLELQSLYEKFGYKRYKTGKFEEYSLYAANRDFISAERVISFTDLDGRLLALKPDVTLSIINNAKDKGQKNEKLYYIENVYRENRENHSYREIRQMGLEFIGQIDRYSILEVLLLAAKSLEEIDKDYLLEISNMEYVVRLLDSLNTDEVTYEKLLKCMRQKSMTGIPETAKRGNLDSKTTEILCQIPFLYGEMGEVLKKARKLCVNQSMEEALDDMEVYFGALKASGFKKNINLDLSMINDIDYYNGIVFRGYIRSLPGCVISGGQYDKAMERLGKDAKGVGFAIYLDELNKGKKHPSEYDVDVLILYDEECGITDIMKAVKSMQKEGKSVRAERSAPEGLRCRELYELHPRGKLHPSDQLHPSGQLHTRGKLHHRKDSGIAGTDKNGRKKTIRKAKEK